MITTHESYLFNTTYVSVLAQLTLNFDLVLSSVTFALQKVPYIQMNSIPRVCLWKVQFALKSDKISLGTQLTQLPI